MNRIAGRMVLLLLSFCIVFAFAGCKKKEDYSNVDNPVVTMEFEDFGVVEIELYPQVAPNTVKNFIHLIEQGFYDGLTIHRVVPGFVIQGGDPNGDGTGGPGYTIKGEFKANGYSKNNLKHTQGVISMARRSNSYNSAGSQFFIMLGDHASLDGDYAAFGKVISGMDVIFDIGTVPTNKERPEDPVVIKKVTVDTKGHTYGEPEKIK
ncbi:MAG: peptidylprolyl isomerase [Clostridiaceae bacterium]|nr:peptidylprolyl isomerase [Clostridiaceae bacterium]